MVSGSRNLRDEAANNPQQRPPAHPHRARDNNAAAILGAWLEGHPLALLAVGNIDPWLPQSRHLGLALADIHGWLGNAVMWLAGLHATAALYHHFWRRDTVLLSMLPGR